MSSFLQKAKESYTKVKDSCKKAVNFSRNKLIALLTNKPGSVENCEDLLQQIDYLNTNKQLDIHIAKMLKGVLSIRNMRARDLMIPRAHIDFFDISEELPVVLTSVLQYGHSRYPVLTDDSDNQESIGILFTKDLLRILIDGTVDNTKLVDITRPIKIIPETKHVTTLLQEFQSSHTHLALVVNEFGEISGLITIEDILEEIVGDISDEFDKEDNYIQQVSKTSYDVLAKTPIYLFNEAFGTELDDSEFDTIGGYVFGLIGHMPSRNEAVELIAGELTARITQVNERTILKLRVRTNNERPVYLTAEQRHAHTIHSLSALANTQDNDQPITLVEQHEESALIDAAQAGALTTLVNSSNIESRFSTEETTSSESNKNNGEKAGDGKENSKSSLSAVNNSVESHEVNAFVTSETVSSELVDSQTDSQATSTTDLSTTATADFSSNLEKPVVNVSVEPEMLMQDLAAQDSTTQESNSQESLSSKSTTNSKASSATYAQSKE